MEKRERMDDFTKMKLVFSGELLIFAVVFLVLGILRLTGVIQVADDWKRYLFPIITLCGCTWFVVDLIWALASKKHREKSSLVDKSLVVPSSILVIIFDIYVLIKDPLMVSKDFFRYFTGSLFCYFALVYVFLAIYHYYKPIKYLVKEYEKLKEEERLELEKELELSKDENSSDEKPAEKIEETNENLEK